ncbi:mucin-20 [Pteronotus mesoamericanus]|uniref:mucin-20 n=1 Tax=Pteronotus mesoamericanus TaxID=1884717 RepID=UPI0023EAA6E4|nr:mucin-20 [Pteronotus parnellii mesoamericanus]
MGTLHGLALPLFFCCWEAGAAGSSTGRDEGFLLLQLSVASPEELTDLRVAKRLMHHLHREMHAHMPPTQVSLLHVRRD